MVAGVLSGRSTVDYVLGRDAHEAALHWAGALDAALQQPGSSASRVLDKDLHVLDATKFQQDLASQPGKQASVPANQSFNQPGFGLVEALDRMTIGWALGRDKQPKDEFVSKLDGFAVLDADHRAMARSKRHSRLMAVFGLDLDRFKDVNDTLGGDALLEEVGARLKESVRDVDLVGRLGGDEFAIVAEDLTTPEDAIPCAARLHLARRSLSCQWPRGNDLGQYRHRHRPARQ